MADNRVHFVTYFSKEFLIQGSVAIDSYVRFNTNSKGYVLCLDDITANYLRQKQYGDQIQIKGLHDFPLIQTLFREFLTNRSFAESIISIKPTLIYQILKEIPENDCLLYFDADIFFYSSIESIVPIILSSEVVLSRHLFPSALSSNKMYGEFNAGFLAFRNSTRSLNLLLHWQSQCAEWCHLVAHDNRYGDQKYLDSFESIVGVNVLNAPGINNGLYYFKEKRQIRYSNLDYNLFIEQTKLICFHFHGFKIYHNFILTSFHRYGLIKNFILVFIMIYWPYIKCVKSELNDFFHQKLFESESVILNLPEMSMAKRLVRMIKLSLIYYRI
jgi:hypothetical protein